MVQFKAEILISFCVTLSYLKEIAYMLEIPKYVYIADRVFQHRMQTQIFSIITYCPRQTYDLHLQNECNKFNLESNSLKFDITGEVKFYMESIGVAF